MKISAWRIVKKRHRASAFTGAGARRYGGRWNSKGVAVIYTAQNASLAALEMLVHLRVEHVLTAYFLVPVSFDSALVEGMDVRRLPKNWRADPPPAMLQDIGDDWIATGSSAVLRVPSAIIAQEWNYLLNPAHQAFPRCQIGKPISFRFDPRLKA